MNRAASHARWCAEVDGVFERMHMALREAGVEAKLMRRARPASCGRAHLFVRTSREDREVGRRALRLAAPADFLADMEEYAGPELARPAHLNGVRVR
jgi:hypothetical protein